MSDGIQILSAATITANSTSFRIGMNNQFREVGERPMLGIYGTLGSAGFQLQYKAEDGNWYTTGDTISGLGLFELPKNSQVPLRLAYTAGGGSSISAFVFNGTAE